MRCTWARFYKIGPYEILFDRLPDTPPQWGLTTLDDGTIYHAGKSRLMICDARLVPRRGTDGDEGGQVSGGR